MSELIDSITQQLGGGGMTQIAQQIGADPTATNNAVHLALPVLLGGIAHNAAQPEGAAALNQAVAQHDPSLLDNLGGMLGGLGGGGGLPAGANALGGGLGGVLGGMMGGGGGMGGIGGAILGHVLGGQQAGVTDGVSRASGLQPGQVGKLLMILAPIVMAALAKRSQQQGANPAVVAQQERQQAEQRSPGLGGLLGSIFGGGGNAADQIAHAGPSILGGLLGGR